MVSEVQVCPCCSQAEPVIRFGTNRNGTQRLRCKACRKTWTPQGKSRTLSAEKEALIERALGERLSQRGIARALSVSRDTIRAVAKKRRAGAS